MKAYLYDKNGYFVGDIDCQLDPVVSKIKNKDVYLLPAFATFKKPKTKDNYKSKFNGTKWEYEKIPETSNEYIETDSEKKELKENLIMFQKELFGKLDVIADLCLGETSAKKHNLDIMIIKNLIANIKETSQKLDIINGIKKDKEFSDKEEKQIDIRFIRNKYLSETDKVILIDYPIDEKDKALCLEYRQYLRDYTKEDNWFEKNPLTFDEYKSQKIILEKETNKTVIEDKG